MRENQRASLVSFQSTKIVTFANILTETKNDNSLYLCPRIRRLLFYCLYAL